MPGFFAFPAFLMAFTLPVFLRAEYRSGLRPILLLKMVCSLCFLAFGLLGIVYHSWQGPVVAYDWLVLAGLIFSLLGDMALVWGKQRRPFLFGLVLFLVAQVLYSTAFSLVNELSGWDLLVLVVIVAAVLEAYRFLDMDLGQLKIPVLAYVLVISFMMTKALSTLYLRGLTGPAAWLVPVGAALFFASDGFLALFKFQRHPVDAFRGVNLVTYYLGQVLLALTIYFS
jgi:uncharacterized membrane protein YhhN